MNPLDLAGWVTKASLQSASSVSTRNLPTIAEEMPPSPTDLASDIFPDNIALEDNWSSLLEFPNVTGIRATKPVVLEPAAFRVS
jgi:hypothetical protein